MVNFYIVKKNSDKMLEFLKMATLNTILLLDPSDNHAKQAEINLKNSFLYIDKIFP